MPLGSGRLRVQMQAGQRAMPPSAGSGPPRTCSPMLMRLVSSEGPTPSCCRRCMRSSPCAASGCTGATARRIVSSTWAARAAPMTWISRVKPPTPRVGPPPPPNSHTHAHAHAPAGSAGRRRCAAPSSPPRPSSAAHPAAACTQRTPSSRVGEQKIGCRAPAAADLLPFPAHTTQAPSPHLFQGRHQPAAVLQARKRHHHLQQQQNSRSGSGASAMEARAPL